MGLYNCLKPFFWFEVQNYFLETLALISLRRMILFSVINILSCCKLLIQSRLKVYFNLMILGLLNSELHKTIVRNNLRHFSLTRVQNILKFPLKSNKLEQLLLLLFVLKQKQVKVFANLQPIKRHERFLLKVHITKTIDMIVWIGIKFSGHYMKNWMRMNAIIVSETSKIQTVLNWINFLIMASSIMLIGWVFKL